MQGCTDVKIEKVILIQKRIHILTKNHRHSGHVCCINPLSNAIFLSKPKKQTEKNPVFPPSHPKCLTHASKALFLLLRFSLAWDDSDCKKGPNFTGFHKYNCRSSLLFLGPLDGAIFI